MGENWSDWLWGLMLASIGIAARLGHQWSQSLNATEGGRPVHPVDLPTIISAIVAAPLIGIVGIGIGRWFALPDAAIGGIVGFLGLLGPAALIATWDKLSDVVISIAKKKGGVS